MTGSNLIRDLSAYLRVIIKEYDLIAELQANKPLTVYEQYMPIDNFEDDTYYPLIIVQLAKVSGDWQETTATVLITIGVYGGDKTDGWRDLYNIAERIRQAIHLAPILAEKYQLKMPIEFEPLESQPRPFFFGNMVVNYTLGTPQAPLGGWQNAQN